MKFRLLSFFLLFLLQHLCIINSFAMSKYSKEKNVVEIDITRVQHEISAMTGTIYIYSEKHIEIQLSRLNKTQDKLIELCDRNPSLGLMYPEKKFMPKVTSIRKTGDLVFYVLTGDDALDFMDILHSKGGIEFVLESNCPDTKNSTSGIIHAKFDATGLSRAMERIK